MEKTIFRMTLFEGSEEGPDIIISLMLEIIIWITFVLGTALNAMLIVLFLKMRGFRTLSNRYGHTVSL